MFGRLEIARSRWAAIGAVSVVLVGGGGLLTASASGSPGASSFVPITPCRLLDTRSPGTIGPKATPLEAQTSFTAAVWGTNGNCTIPSDATGLSMNVVAINPTADSYLTIYPADKPLPLSSSLNWVGGQAPTPNAVTVGVSADGQIAFFNNAGTVDLAADIVGYYEPSGSGPAGPQGLPGTPGTNGTNGVTPAQVVWVAKSGGDFTSVIAALASITDASAAKPYVVRIAPGTYTEPAGVALKDYVDLEGSGQTNTVITATTTATSNATVRATGVFHGEVRELTITNTGGGAANAYGLRLDSVTPASATRITDVTVNTTGSTSTNYGTYVNAAAPIITGLTTTATGGVNAYGLTSFAAQPVVSAITALGSGATSLNTGVSAESSSTLVMTDSTATAVSQLVGTSRGVLVTGSTGDFTGVKMAATTTNASFLSSGLIAVGSTVTLSTVTATSSGTAPSSAGIGSISTTITMTNTTTQGLQGINSLGSATYNVRNSTIIGSTNTINLPAGAVTVTNSMLYGGAVTGAATFKCTFTVDEAAVALAANCAG